MSKFRLSGTAGTPVRSGPCRPNKLRPCFRHTQCCIRRTSALPDQEGNEKSSLETNYETWPAVRTPPPRRIVVGTATALAIILGGNLGGVTGALLGLDGGKLAETLQLDTLIPVLGVKRCVSEKGFSFVYPARWLGDQTLYRRQAEAAEALKPLDLPDLATSERLARRRQTFEPAVAFGPMGGTGEDNISVIRAPSPGLILESLGSPQAVAQRLLNQTLAAPGSGKESTLIAASSRRDDAGILYYEFEYLIKSSGAETWRRHNLSVIAASNDVLYTMNNQCSASRWKEYEADFRRSAQSFTIRPPASRQF